MQDVSLTPILFDLPAPLRKILAPRGTKRHCLSSSALNLDTGAICPDRHAFSTTLPHLFPLGRSKKQVPAVGSQVPGTRHPILSYITQTRGAHFRVGPRYPVSGPRRRTGSGAGYQEPGTRCPVPDTWNPGPGTGHLNGRLEAKRNSRLMLRKPKHGICILYFASIS